METERICSKNRSGSFYVIADGFIRRSIEKVLHKETSEYVWIL